MDRNNRATTQRQGGDFTTRKPGNLNWDARYGNPDIYRKQCAIAHRKTHQLCVVCMRSQSQQLHHAYYGKDQIGISVFPVCKQCHDNVCHSPKNWVKNHKNPVWGNRNTQEFTSRLQLGYQLLYSGINHAR